MIETMQIRDAGQSAVQNELELLLGELPLRGGRLLELGCGRAEKTRAIAKTGLPAEIVALEVDRRQHEINLAQEPIPGVEFRLGGAEAIPFDDGRFDFVVMFRSLHHVPVERMAAALKEVSRVLKPGGMAWISEPVFAGGVDQIMRLFYDESQMREAAFAALRQAVEQGWLQLRKQLFFSTRSRFRDFDEFDARMIRVTHAEHRLSPAMYQAVRDKFAACMTPAGAEFLNPQRVDLLVKGP